MSHTIWLASYPKSGNTWLRMLIANLRLGGDAPIDINDTREGRSIASDRTTFDRSLMIDSGLLTHDEVDALRPRLYRALAQGLIENDRDGGPAVHPQFVKVHDAYTMAESGEPLLAGAQAARGAILIVRDPRDLAASLASHHNTSIDLAIRSMADESTVYSGQTDRELPQLRHKILSWSAHVTGWLDQRDVPVHLVRYEDLMADTVRVFSAAMQFAGCSPTANEAARAVTLASFHNLQQQEQRSGFRERPARFGGAAFFRRGETGAWRTELTEQQAASIEARHAPVMRRLAYELSGAVDAANLERTLA